MMTRAEVLRKCITVFEAIRRMASKGNAGLEPERGAEEEYSTVEECVRVMKEWLREMESGEIRKEIETPWTYPLGDLLQGNPLMTQDTIEAARRVDEARDRMIEKYAGRGLMVPNGPMEPDVPKVVDLREWQRIAAEKPQERMDFDEDSLE